MTVTDHLPVSPRISPLRLYLLSDAFDISDTQQAFVYWDRIDSKGKLPPWLRRSKGRKGDIGTGSESTEPRGSFTRDLALWFMLGCSLAAFTGLCGHRDVIHSHAVTICNRQPVTDHL